MSIDTGDKVVLKTEEEITEIEKEKGSRPNWDYINDYLWIELTVKVSSIHQLELKESGGTVWPKSWFDKVESVDFELEGLFEI